MQILIPVLLASASLYTYFISKIAPKFQKIINIIVMTIVYFMGYTIFARLYRSPHSVIETFVSGSWQGKYHHGVGLSQPIGIILRSDMLGSIFLIVIISIAFLVIIYSHKYIQKTLSDQRSSFYYCLIFLIIAGMSGIVLAGDYFNFYVFFEISSLSSCALVAINNDIESLEAAFKYDITMAISSILVIFAISLLFNATGTLNMKLASERVATILGASPHDYLYPYRYVIYTSMTLFIVGFSIKTAIIPTHAWLADAHPVAPAPISALLSGLLVKTTGIYPLIRFLFGIFRIHSISYRNLLSDFILFIACVTIISGSLFAIAQKKLKRMLAFSTVAQMGYILLGIGIITKAGLAGAILHVINHAVVKTLLFLCAGAIIYKTGITQIEDMGLLGYRMPITMICFSVGACSMVGIPPLVGFMSKWALARAAFESNMWFLVIILLISSLLNAIYYFRVLYISWFGGKPTNVEREDPSLEMIAPIFILALLVIFLGVKIKIPYQKMAWEAANFIMN
ncbi:MAG: complex I subunit 5 family protein [bacterium]